MKLKWMKLLQVVRKKNRHTNKKIKNSQGRSAKEIIKNIKENATLNSYEWLGCNGVSRIYDHSLLSIINENILMAEYIPIQQRGFVRY